MHPGQAASFSHALACDEVVGQPLPHSSSPGVDSPTNHPGRAASFFTPLRLPRPASDRGRSASFASGIRPWAECVFCQPITTDTRRGCRARVNNKERRSPCTSTRSIAVTAGPPALTTHFHHKGRPRSSGTALLLCPPAGAGHRQHNTRGGQTDDDGNDGNRNQGRRRASSGLRRGGGGSP